jgi:glycosyltransferase involved in cell wall biosynthesis
MSTVASPAMPRRRVLLSAFACSPQWGSEPGVGWHWLEELAREHDVVLLTHAHFAEHIEPALQAARSQGRLGTVQVQYLQAPALGLHPHRQLNSRLYYSWWQWRARSLVRRLLAQQPFDLIHHLTWGTLRLPCLLGGLGVPLVMGPLGGGEAAPLRLFAGLPWKLRAFDLLRSLTLWAVKLDPLATTGPKQAVLVLCKSAQSLQALPRTVQGRAVVVPEIGAPAVDVSQRVPAPPGQRRHRLLFAGRLLGWKGAALAVQAVAQLVRQGHDVELRVAGDGPLRRHLVRRVAQQGLQDRVLLLGAIPRAELMTLFAQADLFVFPSLHDSSGNVVLEALSRGLPVVCLDLGGPQLYIDAQCGVVVSTQGRSREQVEQALAQHIAQLLADPPRLASLQRHAAEHAARQTWAATVQRAYDVIHARLHWSPTPHAAAQHLPQQTLGVAHAEGSPWAR